MMMSFLEPHVRVYSSTLVVHHVQYVNVLE